MRILWVVGFVLPEAAHLADNSHVAFGGWVGAMLKQLAKMPDIELGVAMKAEVDECTFSLIGNVQYYLVPQSKKDHFDILSKDCDFVLNDFKPDLLHVEGSESAHANSFLNCWHGNNVVSMQGIINGYEPYEYGNLPIGKMLFSLHPVKMIVAGSMILNKWFFFYRRLPKERETIRKAKHILGRTNWDRAHAYTINPEAPYFECNRILRDVFYEQQWDIKKIKRRTIFIGNAASPRKGAHFVLQSLSLLKREYPDIKLYLAGESPFYSSWREWKKIIGYKAYLRYLIKKLDIEDNIVFTGVLQAEDMVTRFMKSHVYVMSSVIENSPNTLGEAMILGVPSVVAYTGGTPDMAIDEHEALFYRDNDPQLLAHQIKRIIDDDALAVQLSTNARLKAQKTHDPERNLEILLQAYRTILSMDDGKED